VRLRVSDGIAASEASVTIQVDNNPPAPTIIKPKPTTMWNVGTQLAFGGVATDPEDGNPPRALDWSLEMEHCPSDCHTHQIQTFEGTRNGSFVAPDHEYPSHLELTLTAADSDGRQSSTSVALHPRTTLVTMRSTPTGAVLGLNARAEASPFTAEVIRGSTNTISAPSPQALTGGNLFDFAFWNVGGPATQTIEITGPSRTYRATFSAQ
jgi:hypothetical protein